MTISWYSIAIVFILFDLFSFNSLRASSKPKTKKLLLKPPSDECSLCLTMHISTLLQ